MVALSVPVSEIVEAAAEKVRSRYVFPDRGDQAARLLETSSASGHYDGLDTATLCDRITEQLYEVCADRHLRLRLRAEGYPETSDPDALKAAWHEQLRLANHGVTRVERLAGNIGYLDIRLVTDPGVGGAAIAAAMELVSHTYALIIDLRDNRGGTPEGVIFWCSYLFPDDETHLNDIFDAESGLTRQYWTVSYLPGCRYIDRPVFVLTSGVTFSGGEEFCYNLQSQRRAVLIGETTRGGAHPTDVFPISDEVEITVPIARSVNPVTGTNWEGVGVAPDVSVPADAAYDIAYARALQHVLAQSVPEFITEQATNALGELPAAAKKDAQF